MPTNFRALSLLLAALVMGVATTAVRHALVAPPGVASGTVVVVELFTSEGCSSCPATDDLLREWLATQLVAGVRIVGLSEYVDYWDRLGWRNPFSSSLVGLRVRDPGRRRAVQAVHGHRPAGRLHRVPERRAFHDGPPQRVRGPSCRHSRARQRHGGRCTRGRASGVRRALPDGSILVKEIRTMATTPPTLYAVMVKDRANGLAGNGWLWAEFGPSGAVAY